MRYIDPDGRATFAGTEFRNGTYSYVCAISSIEGAMTAFMTNLVPFFGDKYVDICFSAPGMDMKLFRDEKPNKYLEKLGKYTDIATVMNLFTSSKVFSVFAEKLGNFTTSLAIINELSDRQSVAIDQLILLTVSPYLEADSHEKVKALYIWSKIRIKEMVDNGDIKYKQGILGNVKVESIKEDYAKIDQLIEELKAMKTVMDRE